MNNQRFSRREFLKVIGLAGAGSILTACAPPSVATPTQAPAQQATQTLAVAPSAVPTAAPITPTAVTSSGKFKEAPALAELVKAGKIPVIDKRLPEDPMIITPLDKTGKYGGKLSSIIADPTGDLFEIEGAIGRSVAIFSYDLKSILPCAVKSWKLSSDSKELALTLRKGMKWSDGNPFTTADVKFWYEDIFLNKDITPTIDKKWAPGNETMKLVVDDEINFRFQFSIPFPAILDFMPTFSPWAPKHYLSNWHIKYNDKANDIAKTEKLDTWVKAFLSHSNHNQGLQLQQDAKLPRINPWVFEKQDTQGNRTYTRNPFYWAVDNDNQQLPYVDTLERQVVENREVLGVKVLAGEGTHHSWFLNLANFPLYKDNEKKSNFTVSLFTDLRASECGFCFNYTHKDEVLRKLFNDIRWRQAVSHAINRDEVKELRFAGMGVSRNPIMHPGPSFWKDGLDQYYTKFDQAKANQLLDEIGLKWDADKKSRLRPDEKPLALTMEVDAGRADLTEVCNLIKGYLSKVGINISIKPQDQQFFIQRMTANDHDIGVWAIGGSSEIYSRQNEPIRYRPPWHNPMTPLGGPLWRQWLDTNGKSGLEPPDIIKRLWEISEAWRKEPFGSDKYNQLGSEMLQINAENCWCIGTVGLVPRVGIIKNSVQNAPKKDMVLSIEYNMWIYYLLEQWWLAS